MSVTNYEDKFLKEEHAAAWLDEFNDWTKLGAHDKMPTFQNFKVTAENLSANLAFDKENEILAADHLSNKKAEEEPRTRIFDLIDEFCKRRELYPKFFIITNIVEKETWDKLCDIKSDGHILPKDRSFGVIMGTKIGKIAGKMGDVKSIWTTELAKADGGEKTEGPSLIFIYTKIARQLKKGGFMALQ